MKGTRGRPLEGMCVLCKAHFKEGEGCLSTELLLGFQEGVLGVVGRGRVTGTVGLCGSQVTDGGHQLGTGRQAGKGRLAP